MGPVQVHIPGMELPCEVVEWGPPWAPLMIGLALWKDASGTGSDIKVGVNPCLLNPPFVAHRF